MIVLKIIIQACREGGATGWLRPSTDSRVPLFCDSLTVVKFCDSLTVVDIVRK